jgi:hypothetical protein
VVQGLQVKVRTPVLADRMRTIQGPVQAVIKLSCAYFTPDKSGLSFEVIDVYSALPVIERKTEFDWEVGQGYPLPDETAQV